MPQRTTNHTTGLDTDPESLWTCAQCGEPITEATSITVGNGDDWTLESYVVQPCGHDCAAKATARGD